MKWIARSMILLPALGGLGFGALLRWSILPNLLIRGQYEAALSWLVSALGTAISLAFGGMLLAARQIRQATTHARMEERSIQAGIHKRFLQRLDHELKNPVAIIRVGITNLRNPLLHSEHGMTLERIEQQAQRLQKLVTDLRWLSQLGERSLDAVLLDIGGLLQDAIETCRAAGPDHNAHIELRLQQLPWPVGRVKGNQDLLGVALCNLIGNAVKFSGRDGHVEVRAADDGRRATIEIADNGIGIGPEDIGHVFDELYRGSNAQEVEGSGLGLALANRIITLHGGSIAIRSRVAQGTVVTVRLPLATGT